MMAATATAMGGPILFAASGQQATVPAASAGNQPRPPRPRPAGIVWISGTGIERQPGPNTWDLKALPTGSAAAAAYQQGYLDLNSVYNTYWQGTKYGAPPRSCFALAWIPGSSLIEVVGAAHVPSSAT